MKRSLLPVCVKAFVDFVTVYGQSEIASDCELDYIALFSYVFSDKFAFKNFETSEKDPDKVYDICMKEIETEVLNGSPIWQFLKISDKLKKVLDKQSENEDLKRKQKRLCFRCRFLEINDTSIGEMYDCEKRREDWHLNHRFERYHYSPFNVKRCKNFKEKK